MMDIQIDMAKRIGIAHGRAPGTAEAAWQVHFSGEDEEWYASPYSNWKNLFPKSSLTKPTSSSTKRKRTDNGKNKGKGKGHAKDNRPPPPKKSRPQVIDSSDEEEDDSSARVPAPSARAPAPPSVPAPSAKASAPPSARAPTPAVPSL